MKLKLSTLATGVAITVVGGLALRALTGGGFGRGGGGGGSFLPAATRANPTSNLRDYALPLTQRVAYNPAAPTPRATFPRGRGTSAPIFDPRLVDISSVTTDGRFTSIF